MEFQTKQTSKNTDTNALTGAKRDSQEGKARFDLIGIPFLYRLSALLVRGAAHYGERNWEKGQNVSRTYASMFRHLVAYGEGERTEDHLAAIAFNVMSIINVENGVLNDDLPGALLDLPFYRKDPNFAEHPVIAFDQRDFEPMTDLEGVVLAYMDKAQRQHTVGIYWFDFKTVWLNTLPSLSEGEFGDIMASLTTKQYVKPVISENKVHPNYALLGAIHQEEARQELHQRLAEEEPDCDGCDSDYCYTEDDDV